jgi:organic radical activating enzyme
MKANLSEIFYSVQGEGILVGVRQLFIRFSGCNLSCYYCDTKASGQCMDFTAGKELKNPVHLDYIQKKINEAKEIHSVCFTGGEPMLYADLIASLNSELPFYLESNMSLPQEARKLRFVEFVAGDLKVREAGNPEYEELIENTIKSFKILKNTRKRLTFCKIVLPERFDSEEVLNSAYAIKDFVYCFVLQPVFGSKVDEILLLQKKMINFKDTRLIPQVHKYLGVR